MRTLLKCTLDTEATNKAILDGSLPKIVDKLMATTKPEAAYFSAADGYRTLFLFFDMVDSSMMPVIGEPLFIGLKARVEVIPVMNQAELQKGLTAFMAG